MTLHLNDLFTMSICSYGPTPGPDVCLPKYKPLFVCSLISLWIPAFAGMTNEKYSSLKLALMGIQGDFVAEKVRDSEFINFCLTDIKDDTIELPVLLIMINTISSPDVARYRGIERANVFCSIKMGLTSPRFSVKRGEKIAKEAGCHLDY